MQIEAVIVINMVRQHCHYRQSEEEESVVEGALLGSAITLRRAQLRAGAVGLSPSKGIAACCSIGASMPPPLLLLGGVGVAAAAGRPRLPSHSGAVRLALAGVRTWRR